MNTTKDRKTPPTPSVEKKKKRIPNQKTVKARLIVQTEDLGKIFALWRIWRLLVAKYQHLKGKCGSEKELYEKLRSEFPEIHSYYISAVMQNPTADYVPLYPQLYKLNNDQIEIKFRSRETIKAKVKWLSEETEELVKKALANKEGMKLQTAQLIKREDGWRIHFTIRKKVRTYKFTDAETFVGADIGRHNLIYAVAYYKSGKYSPNVFSWSGGKIMHLQRVRKIEQAKRQRVGDSYQRVNERIENRIMSELHLATKRFIEYAKQFPKPVIVLEDLEFEVNEKSKKERRTLAQFLRRKIQSMIEYKARWYGIPVFRVLPYQTSITCAKCGSIGERNKATFKCPKCRYRDYADRNASKNIAIRAFKIISGIADAQMHAVSYPNVSLDEETREETT